MSTGCVVERIPLHTFKFICIIANNLWLYRDCCMHHIGVGFWVARSTMIGNPTASESGTSNRYRCPAFFIMPTLTDFINKFPHLGISGYITVSATMFGVLVFFVLLIECFGYITGRKK